MTGWHKSAIVVVWLFDAIIISCILYVKAVWSAKSVALGAGITVRKIPRECQMHNKKEKETQSHVMKFVDLIFVHLLW